MSTVHIRKKLDSDTLHLPELKPFIGRTVEITVTEEIPAVRDEFWAEAARIPETQQAFEAQQAIFRAWRNDARFEAYWSFLDHALARTFDHVRKWAAATKALADLEGYDFDAVREQRECDLQHASDRQHL